jgi:mannosyltransferase OCH1-like enzyme
MQIFKLVVRQFIKIFANTIKLLCYVTHFAFPKMRFTLPRESTPIFRMHPTSRVPRTLWQTNYTDKVHLAVYLNYLFNRLMAPTFDYRFMVTEERREFISDTFGPDITRLYDQLQIGAAQADFWRVLVLKKFGGVYLDIDAHFVWPANLLIKPHLNELYIEIKTGEISNYFIASSPNNPNLDLIIEEIERGISAGTNNDVYSLTGPGVFNRVLKKANIPTSYYTYTVNQGNFTNEFFQYIDKPQGKWTKEQHKVSVLKPPQ